MKRARLASRGSHVTLAVLTVVVVVVLAWLHLGSQDPAAIRPDPASTGQPELRVEASVREITVPSFGGLARIDPRIWVTALGAPLELDVSRAATGGPLTVSQRLDLPDGGKAIRSLPASVADGWQGLAGFLQVTIRDVSGTVVYQRQLTLCPDSYTPQRLDRSGPASSPYPVSCGFLDPFQRGSVWGIASGWGIDPLDSGYGFRLRPGTYELTESITAAYQQLFGITAADSAATVPVTVVPSTSAAALPAPVPPRPGVLPQLPGAAGQADTAAAALPGLAALPAWQISVQHTGSGTDLLTFAATVWNAGQSPLDIQGVRSRNAAGMTAYQYFWQGGKVIGRAPAGNIIWDHDDNRWVYQQLASYQLLGPGGQVISRSQKLGFCVIPSDPVDLTLRSADWRPVTYQPDLCGNAALNASRVRERLPVGWGDTYFPEQTCPSFDITGVPNGRYYIQVTANPDHLLRVADTDNTSLRLVILGGTSGHRTVTVPAWNGVDPEGA